MHKPLSSVNLLREKIGIGKEMTEVETTDAMQDLFFSLSEGAQQRLLHNVLNDPRVDKVLPPARAEKVTDFSQFEYNNTVTPATVK